ncbi:hypothetical protein MLD38_003926 [Melastoma candidum]|uniref:Uncharacterized protein n=1 Tax=Melastoma candidum TaxID=119954 RepID=A0ACB9S787_9MYRT|nr:hypothetical protein MLD38_003926 [Melastoma candidum]
MLPPLLIDLSSWLPTSTQFLLSPNSVFAASFLASSSSNSTFSFSVYYYNLTPTTVVWSSFPVPSSSSLSISSSPSLLYLNTSSGRNAFPGNPSTSSSNSTVSLSLRDEGCLIFGSGWRSFDYPTDTFLPGQTMNGTSVAAVGAGAAAAGAAAAAAGVAAAAAAAGGGAAASGTILTML